MAERRNILLECLLPLVMELCQLCQSGIPCLQGVKQLPGFVIGQDCFSDAVPVMAANRAGGRLCGGFFENTFQYLPAVPQFFNRYCIELHIIGWS